jgi:hypothetical protein
MKDVQAQDQVRESAQDPVQEPAGDVLLEENQGFSRRDFVKLAAILTGSTLLMLSRCKPPLEDKPLMIPPDFKRFVLVEQSPIVATEKIIIAMGSQCPDLNCALWWVSDQEFQFFDSIEQIMNQYVGEGRLELIWLD